MACSRGFALLICCFVLSAVQSIRAERLIEEINVTAQRIEEDAQTVPMSVSAFGEPTMEERQIVRISDLQLNVPNLSYIPDNFGGARVTIRGVGVLSSADSRGPAGPSAPLYVNGISMPVDLSVIEFFDVERVEVMRGPQGTLYGRNATAGAINVVTRMPDLDRFGGYVDLELGDYSHRRLKAGINVPLGDVLAVRVAATGLDREGYIENKAAAQISGLERRIDDRELYGARVTAEWRPREGARFWVAYGRFEEDDSRVRITNQVCKQPALPNLGCEPDQFGLEGALPAATFETVIATGVGASNPTSAPEFEFPRPDLSLRDQHTDFDPSFEFAQDMWLMGMEASFGQLDTQATFGYVEFERVSQQDYSMDVAARLDPTPSFPDGLYPVSAPPGGPGELRGGGPCDLESGSAGIAGPCAIRPGFNRAFAYDQSDLASEWWQLEARIRSRFDGRTNFLLGANYAEAERESNYFVHNNLFDVIGVDGFLPWDLPVAAYPSLFNTGGWRRTEMPRCSARSISI